MVRNRNRIDLALLLIGALIAVVHIELPPLFADAPATPPPPIPTAAATGTPVTVPIIWREFRPGEWQTGPAEPVRVCAAALERGAAKTALIVRFCGSLPETPQRKFALGYDDLVIRAQLPGGVKFGWDLLDYEPTSTGGRTFTQGRLLESNVSIATVRMSEITDVVIVIQKAVPLGLPTLEVSGRFAGKDFDEVLPFASLGTNLESTEAGRLSSTPGWARVSY